MMTELELLQEELKGKLRAKDSNIKEIVEKIQQIQQNMDKADQTSTQTSIVSESG